MAKVRNDDRLRQEMARDGIDLVLAFSMENVFYLSGALFSLQDNIRERLSAAGFGGNGRDFLLCASNEASGVEAACHAGRLETYVEFERAPIEALASLLQETGYGSARIGVEKRYHMAAFHEELAALLPQARLVGGDRVLEASRAIKVPEHVRLITHASRATEMAVAEGFRALRPGM